MLVSIIIACHRKDPYLKKSLESIFSQTYKNIEIIFIANGEQATEVKDYVISLTENFSGRLFIYETKIGQLSHALNIGIEKSNGELIARMDADDISQCDRIEKQVDFLMKNEYDILGSSAYLIDEFDNVIGEKKALSSEKVNANYLFTCPIIHPSVLMKKSSILKIRGYNSGFNSEDYDLWIRAIKSGLKIGNTQEKLLKYRVHKNSTQGSRLAYAEVSGYIVREFLLSFSFKKLISIFINAAKFYKNELKHK